MTNAPQNDEPESNTEHAFLVGLTTQLHKAQRAIAEHLLKECNLSLAEGPIGLHVEVPLWHALRHIQKAHRFISGACSATDPNRETTPDLDELPVHEQLWQIREALRELDYL